jgi:16S rRNA (guanine1207-N2)-methyltransferase
VRRQRPAVEASRATLAANGIEGDVFASNVFSEVTGRFDMIISNPPFHDGLQTSLEAAQTLIRGAVRHLNSGGELRIVANAFLPYPKVLDETFGFHEVIAQTGRFKVYRTVMTRQAKNNSSFFPAPAAAGRRYFPLWPTIFATINPTD